MSEKEYLVLAYAFIWGALAFYLIWMDRRMRRLQGEIDELRRRAGAGGPPRP